MTVFERIELEAKNRGLTISYLTKKAKLSSGTINKWTSSDLDSTKGEPGANKLFKIATELGCSMEYLLTGNRCFDNLTKEDIEWLKIFESINQLPEKNKHECIGYVKGSLNTYITMVKKDTDYEKKSDT